MPKPEKWRVKEQRRRRRHAREVGVTIALLVPPRWVRRAERLRGSYTYADGLRLSTNEMLVQALAEGVVVLEERLAADKAAKQAEG